METVKVSVKGAGSLDVEGYDAKAVYIFIGLKLKNELEGSTVREVKLGRPKKKSA